MSRYLVLTEVPFAERPARRADRPFWGRLLGWFAKRQEKAVAGRALRVLDERTLRDIGLSRSKVAQQMTKPWWGA